jgi:hypothetical protein
MRTSESIEAAQSAKESAENKPKIKSDKRKGNGDGARIKPWQWKPGQSGNPGGRPTNDVAKEIAQAVFSENPELIHKAMTKALMKGSAFAYQVLSDRAYGKLKERLEVSADDSLASAIANARKRAGK